MDLETLERRIRRLEDIEAIKQLKARYAAYCDANYDANALAELFTEDAVWDGGALGRNVGREAIRQFFRGSSQRIIFAVHNILSPIIEIDGDTATGTWYLLQTCTYAAGNQAVWGAATYHDRYVRHNGTWKFQHVRIESHFWTPFEEGWARTPFIARRS
jgi:ketosteroid isomerase-like protein